MSYEAASWLSAVLKGVKSPRTDCQALFQVEDSTSLPLPYQRAYLHKTMSCRAAGESLVKYNLSEVREVSSKTDSRNYGLKVCNWKTVISINYKDHLRLRLRLYRCPPPSWAI